MSATLVQRRVAVVSRGDAGVALGNALAPMGFPVDRHESARAAVAECADALMIAIDATGGAPDGFEGIRLAREGGFRGGLVALVDRDDWASAVLALEMGADSILEAPVHPRVAGAYARRMLRARSLVTTIRVGTLEMQLPSRTASVGGAPLILTESEFDLLACLAQRAGEPLSREELLASTSDERLASGRAIDSRICRLRARLAECGGPAVVTLRHRGYQLAA